MLVVWAFDLKAQKNLNNYLIWSDDGGKTWRLPADTGLRGQAANFLLHGSRLALLQARREGNTLGICLNVLAFTNTGTVKTGPDCWLWNADAMAEVSGNIEQQFSGLKFGQPSVLHLEGTSYLLIFWQCFGNTFSIRTRHFTIDDLFEETRKTGK